MCEAKPDTTAVVRRGNAGTAAVVVWNRPYLQVSYDVTFYFIGLTSLETTRLR
jgi:hypothetical protein